MPPSGVDYASEFLNGYAPEYVDIPVTENVYINICCNKYSFSF